MTDDIWSHRAEALTDEDLIDFEVVAVDGRLGRVAATAYDREQSYIVVELDPPAERSVVVPVGVVEAVDLDDELVRVSCAREQARNAPEYQPQRDGDADYVEALGAYWGEVSDDLAG
jgi:hypothetical protein